MCSPAFIHVFVNAVLIAVVYIMAYKWYRCVPVYHCCCRESPNHSALERKYANNFTISKECDRWQPPTRCNNFVLKWRQQFSIVRIFTYICTNAYIYIYIWICIIMQMYTQVMLNDMKWTVSWLVSETPSSKWEKYIFVNSDKKCSSLLYRH